MKGLLRSSVLLADWSKNICLPLHFINWKEKSSLPKRHCLYENSTFQLTISKWSCTKWLKSALKFLNSAEKENIAGNKQNFQTKTTNQGTARNEVPEENKRHIRKTVSLMQTTQVNILQRHNVTEVLQKTKMIYGPASPRMLHESTWKRQETKTLPLSFL